MSLNLAVLHGNVGNDPVIKVIAGDKKVAKFSLATGKSYTNSKGEKITETAWHNIVVWNKLADLAEKWVKKGSSVIIEGSISYRSYENKDGVTVYITEINADRLHFAGAKKEDKAETTDQAEEKWYGKKPVTSMSNPDDLGKFDDSELPY